MVDWAVDWLIDWLVLFCFIEEPDDVLCWKFCRTTWIAGGWIGKHERVDNWGGRVRKLQAVRPGRSRSYRSWYIIFSISCVYRFLITIFFPQNSFFSILDNSPGPPLTGTARIEAYEKTLNDSLLMMQLLIHRLSTGYHVLKRCESIRQDRKGRDLIDGIRCIFFTTKYKTQNDILCFLRISLRIFLFSDFFL